MFTPPPSPLVTTKFGNLATTQDALDADVQDRKRAQAKRLRWTVLLVPLVVTIVTLSSQHASHPAILKMFGPSLHDPLPNISLLHKRHPQQVPQADSMVASSLASTSILVMPTTPSAPTSGVPNSPASSSLPTVPVSPVPIPTPFPQPLDSAQQNFSSQSCSDFTTNMTNSAAFRTCRPFSLLLQSSDAFGSAQSNLTLMNTIIYGTCNTTTDENQCDLNMRWFEANMKSACADEISQSNSMVMNTILGLEAFSLMYDVGCLVDPTTNAYCYESAVFSSNPSDLYYYQLPLGIGLPNTSTLTCSACSRNVMELYTTNIDSSNPVNALKSTYRTSAALTNAQCQNGFALNINASASFKPALNPILSVVVVGITAMLGMGALLVI